MKIVCTLLLLLLVSMNLLAQNPIAQLKFEDAEKAFNAGDFAKALHYVEETEKLIGVTSRTLYLKIVAQDGLLVTDPSRGQALTGPLKTNVAQYLNALKSQPIDEKYRRVYAISKKWEGAGSKDFGTGSGDGPTPPASVSGDVLAALNAYHRAVWGLADAHSIRTVVMLQEIYREGQLISQIDVKRMAGQSCVEMTMPALAVKMVYRDRTGYTLVGGTYKVPMSPEMLESCREATTPGKLLPEWFDREAFSRAWLTRETFNGIVVDALVLADKTAYFDQETHLLIAQKGTDTSGRIVTTQYQDYRRVNGIQFPFTVVATAVGGTTAERTPEGAVRGARGEGAAAVRPSATGGIGGRRGRNKKQPKPGGVAALGLMRPVGGQQQTAQTNGLNAKTRVAGIKSFSGLTAQSPSPGGTSQAGSVTILKIKSLVINQPLADALFE